MLESEKILVVECLQRELIREFVFLQLHWFGCRHNDCDSIHQGERLRERFPDH